MILTDPSDKFKPSHNKMPEEIKVHEKKWTHAAASLRSEMGIGLLNCIATFNCEISQLKVVTIKNCHN